MCHIKTKLDDWFSWTLKNEVRVAQARLLGAEKGPDESGQNRATSRHQERPLLGAYHLALCVSAQAQQPKKVPRVGFLTLLTHPDPREEEFVQGLRELGHIDGQNITIEYRRSAGEVEHLATLAKELVRLKVDLIVARSTPAIEAAKNVTKTIPMRDARSRRPGQKRLRRQLGAPRREHHGQFQYQSGTCRQET